MTIVQKGPWRMYRSGHNFKGPYHTASPWGRATTIHRLLQNTPLEAEDIERLVAAYEQTLRALDLVERDDPLTQAVAKKIIEIGQTSIRDPADFRTCDQSVPRIIGARSGTDEALIHNVTSLLVFT
jgi:hypothetical protein